MGLFGASRGTALSNTRPRVLKTGDAMGLPWDAYYVLTKANAGLNNSRIHPNTGAPNYNILHNHAATTNLNWASAGHTIDTDLDIDTNKVINVVDPTVDQDAATKKYVDDNAVSDHGVLGGLLDDDHTQYALLAGRSGGQTLIGGIDSGDDLTLESTSHGTKGKVIVSLGTNANNDFVVGNNNALVVEGDTDDTHISGKLFIEDNSYWDSEVPADFLNDSTAAESYLKGQLKIDAGNANTALALYADNGGAPLGDDYFVIWDTSNPGNPNKLFRVQRGADSGSASVTIAGNQATFLRLGVHSIKADTNPNIFEIESGNTFDLILDAGGGGDANLQIQAAGVGINEAAPDAMLEIVADAADEECLHLKGAASQSADILTTTDSSDNLGFRINANLEPLGDKFKVTSIGGYAIKLTNQTGAVTIAGQLVKADTATNDAIVLAAAGDVECFGVFLDSGVADGSEAWVIVSGIADVALDDNVAAVRGNWMATGVAAGYAATQASPAAAPTHFEEIGHCIETVTAGGGGTHILARCVLHFN